MRRILIAFLLVNASALAVVACTTKQAEDASKVAEAILCAIEHAELDDAQLNALCGALGAGEKRALTAHRKTLVEAKTILVQAKCKDGGP